METNLFNASSGTTQQTLKINCLRLYSCKYTRKVGKICIGYLALLQFKKINLKKAINYRFFLTNISKKKFQFQSLWCKHFQMFIIP